MHLVGLYTNTNSFIFIQVLQLLVLLIGARFNKVITTFVNNILEDRILYTVLHVWNASAHVNLKLLTQLSNFKLLCRVFGSIPVADKTIGTILICCDYYCCCCCCSLIVVIPYD